MIKGQVVSGRFGEIKVRQKAGAEIELGELLVADTKNGKVIMQVYDLHYGSQISDQNLELISGMQLEEDTKMDFMDPELRNYTIAYLKNLIGIGKKVTSSKALPEFFSTVRTVTEDDLKFLTAPANPLYLGKLRSGTKALDVPLFLPGDKVFSHHVLITGTTGKGKSTLMSNLIWNATKQDYCAMLVLDPHDEYFGRNNLGLKDYPEGKVIYYTSKDVPPGGRSLNINLKVLRPDHFDFLGFTSAQNQALNAYFKEYSANWVEAIVLEKSIKGDFHEATTAVLKRRILSLLDLDFHDNQLFSEGIFHLNKGESTIPSIVKELENGKTVIIDTSNFSGQVELLVGSVIATELFKKYKHYKMTGELKQKPVVSIVLEEAPRVLGKEVLETGSNIFSTIAREGRKFKVGLCQGSCSIAVIRRRKGSRSSTR